MDKIIINAPKILDIYTIGNEIVLNNEFKKIKNSNITNFHPNSETISINSNINFLWNNHFLFLKFQVKEKYSKADFYKDGDEVWQDSAVEFFVKDALKPNYYTNFEFNSNGACLAEYGTNRNDRIRYLKKQYKLINRKVKSHKNKWSLTLAIPWYLFLGTNKPEDIKYLEFNAFKCSSEPKHWASLFPIETEVPNFHRPDCFNKLFLK